MKIKGKDYRTIWLENDQVRIIDQSVLPFEFKTEVVVTASQMEDAIKAMRLRGAPLIGVAGAFGAYLAAKEISAQHSEYSNETVSIFEKQVDRLLTARPTAVNLRWAIQSQLKVMKGCKDWKTAVAKLLANAQLLADDDVSKSKGMGEAGFPLLKRIAERKHGDVVNVLTHCNAGWLATVDLGTATAPLYLAHRAGMKLHIWVDETRPRMQGAKLTAFELAEEGIPHTIIVDNAGGHLMQQGKVDICIVGTDRTTRSGDVTNKIGTYLKALAAKDNNVPFYAAVPSSSIDWNIKSGSEVPIEERSDGEVLYMDGESKSGKLEEFRVASPGSRACNPGFDVTPSKLLSGLITERGVCEASEEGLRSLFPVDS